MKRRRTKKASGWKDIIRLLALIMCGTILGVNVYMLNANTIVGNRLPMPFGYGAAVVLSGSMEPEISEGDLIVVKETEIFSENDVVVYDDTESLVVHRIVDINGENITTKGDANPVADQPIHVSAIKGTVVIVIPFAGRLVDFLKTPVGTFLIITVAIALVEMPRRREKEKDEEERQRILDEIQRLRNENEEI